MRRCDGATVRWLLFVFVVVLATPVASQEQVRIFYDGSMMLRICESAHARDEGRCQGFAVAIADLLVTEKLDLRACFPATVTARQITDIARKHLSDHPADRQFLAAELIAQAIAEAFPCAEE